MTDHPTPWTTGQHEGGIAGGIFGIMDANGKPVYTHHTGAIEFINHRVNAHDALVEAAGNLIDSYKGGKSTYGEIMDNVVKLEIALAVAKG